MRCLYFCFVFVSLTSFSQTISEEEYQKNKDQLLEKGVVTYVTVFQGDTMPMMQFEPVKVSSQRVFKSKKQRRRYRNLERKVRRTYPYAKEAGIRLKIYNDTLSKIKNEIKRKAYTKKAEKQIKKEFMKDLTKLTISEGRILVRLVDRETGQSSYQLLRELRGVISATFWQTFAKIWGNNLKNRYDPSQGEDKIIEQIIKNIENGAYD